MMPLAVLVSVVLLVGNAQPDDPKKEAQEVAEELQRLQGTWQAEVWDEAGQAATEAELKERGVFVGGNVFILRRDGKSYLAATAQLDPSQSPRTVNLVIKDGPGKDGVMLGIYSLEDDTLKLCFDPKGQSRPEDFKPEAKDGFTLLTLKKPKPAVEEKVDIIGRYRSELTEPTGKQVITEARVEKRGDAYLVTYTQGNKVLFVGTALRRGDQLSMCWVSAGRAGVSVYTIEEGPKLVGEYTVLAGVGLTGKEVLTPWKRID